MDRSLIITGLLNPAQQRMVQREAVQGKLTRLGGWRGVYTDRPQAEWTGLVQRHRISLLSYYFQDAVVGFSTAFNGFSCSNLISIPCSTISFANQVCGSSALKNKKSIGSA